VPDLLTEPTAELAFGLLIAVARHLRAGDVQVRSGEFRGWRPQLYGSGLAGKTLGLIGLGAVGRAVAERAVAFRMTVVYDDPKTDEPAWQRLALHELLSRSDFVMPLVPLSPQTRHLIDAEALRHMKPGAYLVNVGRGSLVDEAAVAASLEWGRLAGYAADVFELEDWAIDERTRHLHPCLNEWRHNTFFTPHLGSATHEARLSIEMEAVENILDFLAGRRPRSAANDPGARRRQHAIGAALK
jgi:phosphonate dehydrogenase